jgi:hypothetical protein
MTYFNFHRRRFDFWLALHWDNYAAKILTVRCGGFLDDGCPVWPKGSTMTIKPGTETANNKPQPMAGAGNTGTRPPANSRQ